MLHLHWGLAVACDRCDPLAGFHDRFVVADPDLIYLAATRSAGCPNRPEPALLRWSPSGGSGWLRAGRNGADLPTTVGDQLAEHILGARPGEVVVSDSTSVNIYKLASAALAAGRGRSVIVTDDRQFPDRPLRGRGPR